MCSSSATGGRPADDLYHPDQETVARDDRAREHRRHHDGEKQETAQFLVSGVLRTLTVRQRQGRLPLYTSRNCILRVNGITGCVTSSTILNQGCGTIRLWSNCPARRPSALAQKMMMPKQRKVNAARHSR